jgi:branched-chain amino acid transport system substrate-binding protein
VFLDQPGNIGNAGDTALGHYISHAFNIETNKQTEQFGNDYKAKTGHYPAYIEPQTVFGMQMLAVALKQTKPAGDKVNVTELAKNLEKVKIVTPMGETSIRAADHQVLLPLVVSRVEKDVKYKVDGTDMGFKVIKKFSAEEAANPVQASCKMQRPS